MRDGYLIEWWSPPGDEGEPNGRWTFADDPVAAKMAIEAIPIPEVWEGAIRITLLREARVDEAVSTGLDEIRAWSPSCRMPRSLDGLTLPPKAPGEIRLTAVAACGEALAIALRARLLSRRQLGELLVTIDRAFEAHELDRVQAGCMS